MFKNIKSKIFLIFTLCFLSNQSYANSQDLDWTFKFGGWSKHSEDKNIAGRDWNERHNGFGLKKVFSKKEKFDIFGEFFYMKDSYDLNSGYLGMGLEYAIPMENDYFNIKINTLTGLLQRNIHEYTFETDTLVSENKIQPFIMYYLTVEIMKKYELDFSYIPRGTSMIQNEVFFIRLGYKF